MSAIHLVPAGTAEVDALWPAARAAHLFADKAALRAFRDEAPWRVRVDARDRAAIVDVWRPHLPLLSIRGLWAPGREVPAVVDDLRSLARSHELTGLLSPLVTREGADPYRRAGLEPCATLVALRSSVTQDVERVPAPEGVGLRPGSTVDLMRLREADHACFEPFWAYGEATLAQALALGSVTLAEEAGKVIGYTLCTVERGSGTLGRIGVVPGERGRGVGAALLREALRAMARKGAGSVSLCTQEENVDSRSLYARFGLRELPGRLELLIGDVE